jgi:MFS family permease
LKELFRELRAFEISCTPQAEPSASAASKSQQPRTDTITPMPNIEESAYRKVTWRLLPFLMLCYMAAYLDRVNIGFARLQMLGDLRFSEVVYGTGAGMFFIGYFLFEVPSNMILHRVGARMWIGRIMITWGLVSAAFMFVTTPAMFYVLRFTLGVAEAGFFPGIILYLTYWYPARRRARIVALFMTAIPLSGVLGGPISGWIMASFAGVYGLRGWQWLFVLEAIPAVVLGVATMLYLDNGIAPARWLTQDEKRLLQRNLEHEHTGAAVHHGPWTAFRDRRMWLMCAIYFCIVMGQYGLTFWLPAMIEAAGARGVLQIGLLTAIPYSAAAVTMVLFGRSGDRRGERRWHTAIPMLMGSAGLTLSVLAGHNVALAIAALTLAAAGIMTCAPLFWSLPTAFLGGAAAAAGIAAINSVGNLAGFVSPYVVGWLKDQTQSTAAGMYALSVVMVVGAALILTIPARVVNR